MDKSKLINKSVKTEPVGSDDQHPQPLVYEEAEFKKKQEVEESENPEEETAPGPVHSALGHFDASNAGHQLKGEVKTKINTHTDAREDLDYDRPAGFPVLHHEKKHGEK